MFGSLMAKPCTTFTFKSSNGNIFFGRNFDFPTGVGLVNINPKDFVKQAFVQPPEKSFQWRSKYGSISFNQIGREFPYGGMNEAGLVIEQMWLNEAQYPEQDKRYGLTELQWIQYQLDMSASVDDVIKSDTLVRISSRSVASLHFLVADALGNTVVIEYLNGEMNVYRNHNLPCTVLANCPYERSVKYTKYKGNTAAADFSDWTKNSSGRFAKAAKMIKEYQNQPSVDYAYSILDSVSQHNGTHWSIVYDINKKDIYIKTQRNNDIRKITLSSFCFDAGCSIKLQADIHSKLSPGKDFRPFRYDNNLRLLNEVCSSVDFLGSNMPTSARVATISFAQKVLESNIQQIQ